ncbi:hypothetical protein Scep_012134 [Stephania cephalantha]|uniref:Uncharacterized protein n=1 Tax=Stephania cephalantha TaxID=152367 RepID=A0AAP0JEE2_9MAGN
MKGIARVHERYIIRRWRKDVLQRHLSIVHSRGYPQMIDEFKEFKEIKCVLHEAVDLCTNNPARMGFLKTKMDAPIERILTMFVVEGGRGRSVLDKPEKDEELEEIVVKAKAVEAKAKANQLA